MSSASSAEEFLRGSQEVLDDYVTWQGSIDAGEWHADGSHQPERIGGNYYVDDRNRYSRGMDTASSLARARRAQFGLDPAPSVNRVLDIAEAAIATIPSRTGWNILTEWIEWSETVGLQVSYRTRDGAVYVTNQMITAEVLAQMSQRLLVSHIQQLIRQVAKASIDAWLGAETLPRFVQDRDRILLTDISAAYSTAWNDPNARPTEDLRGWINRFAAPSD